MPTRRELHDRARQEQRHRLAAAKADNPKSAIVGIGARDPLTGLYEVLLPDGSIETGEKAFSSSLPQGSQVLGIPKETGGWVLDERDAVPSPIAPVVEEPTGKIKYLYSVLNADGSKDLWLGGWQPKPVKIKAISPGEAYFFMVNPGGNGYLVDYLEDAVLDGEGAYTSLTRKGIVYRYTFAAFSPADGLAPDLYGYSFFSRPAYGSGAGGFPYWGKLFQGVFLGGLNTNATGLGHYYVLPNLISPKEFAGDGVYHTAAINPEGTRGVGLFYSGSGPDSSETIIALSTAIVETGVEVTSDPLLAGGYFDCFDDHFSAIDTATFSADVLHKAKFTGSIGLYGFDAMQQRTVKTTVYGIPVAQRSTATLIGRPSYHPRTTTLKP